MNNRQGITPEEKAQIFQPQIDAFLSITESKIYINYKVITGVILQNILPNERENNQRFIEDLSITNPLIYLKCNQINVKTQY